MLFFSVTKDRKVKKTNSNKEETYYIQYQFLLINNSKKIDQVKSNKAYFSFPSLAHAKLFAHINYCKGYPRVNSGCFPPTRFSVCCCCKGGGAAALKCISISF